MACHSPLGLSFFFMQTVSHTRSAIGYSVKTETEPLPSRNVNSKYRIDGSAQRPSPYRKEYPLASFPDMNLVLYSSK